MRTEVTSPPLLHREGREEVKLYAGPLRYVTALGRYIFLFYLCLSLCLCLSVTVYSRSTCSFCMIGLLSQSPLSFRSIQGGIQLPPCVPPLPRRLNGFELSDIRSFTETMKHDND